MSVEQATAARCNIGPAEIARRRRSAVAMTAAAVAIGTGLIVADVHGIGRLLVVWPVAAAAAVNWLQVVHRFCVAFGALGLENFGRLGEQGPVDAAIRAQDRRRALQLVIEGGAIGLAVALAAVALPI